MFSHKDNIIRNHCFKLISPRTCAAYSEPVRARPRVGAPPVGALLRSVAGTVLVAPGAGVVRETEGCKNVNCSCTHMV